MALAALGACASGPPHPQGWQLGSNGTWTTTSGAGVEWYRYRSYATQGSLSDLASSQAVETVQRYRGARLLRSIPFSACPGEAGVATYNLPHRRVLEVAFSVNSGMAIRAEYERPASVVDAAAVTAAFRQAVCFTL